MPLSALKRDNLERLPEVIARHLPESPQLYPPDQVTDVSDRFMAAEIIREKLTRRLQEELPYGIAVEIEGMGEARGRAAASWSIQAVIWVERTGQKAIVIGKGGELLKEVGRAARLDLQAPLRPAACTSSCGSRCARAGRTTRARCASSGSRRERRRRGGCSSSPRSCCTTTRGATRAASSSSSRAATAACRVFARAARRGGSALPAALQPFGDCWCPGVRAAMPGS